MRKRLVDSYTDPVTEVRYGLRGDPLDFNLSQEYTHAHMQGVTRDFLMKGETEAAVSGFGYTLAGGLSLSVAAGHAYDADGLDYETITDPAGQPTLVTFDAADAMHPRIDVVYLLLEPTVQALPVPRTFRRIRTQSELEAGQAPYLPENITRFSEEHTKASVRVRKGTPAAVPAASALNANEVALYNVRVNANAATLVAGNITDRRHLVRSLQQAWDTIDALAASPAFTGLNEAIDDRAAVLIADSTYLTRTYADEPNDLLTLDVDLPALYVPLDARYPQLSNLNELIDDRQNANTTVTANTGLQRSYDDAGNLFTWAGVAASGAAMGMMPAAHFALVNAATDAATASTLMKRDVNGATNLRHLALAQTAGGAHPTMLTVSNPGTGTGTGSQVDFLEGGATFARLTSEFSVQNPFNEGAFRFYLAQYPTFTLAEIFRLSYNSPHATVFGNLNVTGSISKGSGMFHIDHPLDPNNKDLVHAFVESSKHLLIYRLQVTAEMGEVVTVNLDTHLGFTAGTFAALCQAGRVETARVNAVAADEQTYVVVGPITAAGAARTIDVSWFSNAVIAPEGTRHVYLMVTAERADNYIKTAPYVDVNGRLVPEQLKPVPTAAELELLEPVTETVPEGDPRAGQTLNVLASVLTGMQGFPRHPAAIPGGGNQPLQPVTYEISLGE